MMISFKDFLTEARMAPLYHATIDSNVRSILTQDKLVKSEYNKLLDSKSVSFTRSLKWAIELITVYKGGGGVVFEFDQQKLTHNHKLIPFNWNGQSSVEQPRFSHRDKDGKRVYKYNPNDGKAVYTYDPSAVNVPTDRPARETSLIMKFYSQFEESTNRDVTNLHKYLTKIYLISVQPSILSDIKAYSEKYQIPLVYI